MKKIYLLLFFLFLSFGMAIAQWKKSFPSGITANDVYFTSEQEGFVVGSLEQRGIVIKTTNGGRSWQKIYTSSTSSTFHSVWFSHFDTGYILTDNALLKTIDAGKTWSQLANIPGGPQKLQFTSPQVGYIIVENGAVLKTTDSGTTWKTTTRPAYHSGYANNISFASDSVGYVSSEFELFKTVNGGQSWKKIDHTGGRITSIHFMTEKIGYFHSDFGTVYQTTDGGITWHTKNISASFIYFIDQEQGLFFENRGSIYRTNDGGDTYRNAYGSKYSIYWKAAHFPTKSFGCAIGSDGAIVLSSDGGQSWQMVNPPSGNYMPYHDMHFFADGKGMVVGEFYGILRSPDAGASWYLDEKALDRNDQYGLYFSGLDTGMVVITSNYHIPTYDGGKTFLSNEPRSGPFIGHRSSTDYCFVNSKVIFSTGSSVGYAEKIAKSTDGGKTWSLGTTPPYENTLASITFPGPDTGYACGLVGKVVKTINGGKSWEEQHPLLNNDLEKIYFRTPRYGFAIGRYGAIIRTTDGGENWTQVSSGIRFPLVAIHFLTDSLGYVASSVGQLARTTDAGITWKVLTSEDELLNDAIKYYFKDSTSVVAMTTYGIYQRDLTDRNQPPPPPLITGLPEDNVAKWNFELYPNPARTNLQLHFPEHIQAYEVKIFNCLGELTGSFKDFNDPFSVAIDVSMLPPGIYLLRVESKHSQLFVRKFIKY